MSTEAERVHKIARLVQDDLIVDAVELPANHKKKSHIVNDIEDILDQFDDDMDYAHFVVRVKRSSGSLKTLLKSAVETAAEPGAASVSFESLVDETLGAVPEKTRLPTDSDPEKDPVFLLENAKLLQENGEYALARAIYASVVKSGVKMAEGYAGLARTYEKEGLLEQAVRGYREAIAYASELPYYQALAALQIRVGDDREASKTLIHALGMKNLPLTEEFELHKSLGNCFTRLSDFDKAGHHYARAYELNPKSDVLQVNVGSLALQKKDNAAALEHFQKALDLNHGNDKAVCGIGMVFLAQKDAQRAFEHFLSALRMNPGNITALLNLSKCGLELKKYEETAQALDRYLAQNPAPPKHPGVLELREQIAQQISRGGV